MNFYASFIITRKLIFLKIFEAYQIFCTSTNFIHYSIGLSVKFHLINAYNSWCVNAKNFESCELHCFTISHNTGTQSYLKI